jgi:thioredoxin 1
MGPIVTRLATDYSGRALVGTVDTLEQGGLTQSWGITGVPTFVFFKNGQEVSPRQVGTTSYENLAGRLNALIAAQR